MTEPVRWPGLTDERHSQWYIERFRSMAAQDTDLAGEARLVDAMVAPNARILDAGCGPGRTAGALHARGHRVVGVDIDPLLIEAARHDHPGPQYLVADLAGDLPAALGDEPFDAVVCAGNVMAFLAPGSEQAVLTNACRVLRVDGFALVGFQTNRYAIESFDAHARAAGFDVEQRFATWDLRPWREDAGFAVTVLRKPAEREADRPDRED